MTTVRCNRCGEVSLKSKGTQHWVCGIRGCTSDAYQVVPEQITRSFVVLSDDTAIRIHGNIPARAGDVIRSHDSTEALVTELLVTGHLIEVQGDPIRTLAKAYFELQQQANSHREEANGLRYELAKAQVHVVS